MELREFQPPQTEAPTGQMTRSYGERFTAMVQEAVLIGVKWLIVSVIALFGVGWILNDYGVIRDQARYVMQVRQQQAQQQQAQAAAQQARPSPQPPSVPSAGAP